MLDEGEEHLHAGRFEVTESGTSCDHPRRAGSLHCVELVAFGCAISSRVNKNINDVRAKWHEEDNAYYLKRAMFLGFGRYWNGGQ